MLTDVTERRKVEAQLWQSLRLEAVGQMTGGIAHDFNNLLTIIIGNAELIEEAEDPSLRALAEVARKAAERGADRQAARLFPPAAAGSEGDRYQLADLEDGRADPACHRRTA